MKYFYGDEEIVVDDTGDHSGRYGIRFKDTSYGFSYLTTSFPDYDEDVAFEEEDGDGNGHDFWAGTKAEAESLILQIQQYELDRYEG